MCVCAEECVMAQRWALVATTMHWPAATAAASSSLAISTAASATASLSHTGTWQQTGLCDTWQPCSTDTWGSCLGDTQRSHKRSSNTQPIRCRNPCCIIQDDVRVQRRRLQPRLCLQEEPRHAPAQQAQTRPLTRSLADLTWPDLHSLMGKIILKSILIMLLDKGTFKIC